MIARLTFKEKEEFLQLLLPGMSDLGEYDAVRQALLRMEKAGKIQKIMRGVYY